MNRILKTLFDLAFISQGNFASVLQQATGAAEWMRMLGDGHFAGHQRSGYN
jgi:hypothetical protein